MYTVFIPFSEENPNTLALPVLETARKTVVSNSQRRSARRRRSVQSGPNRYTRFPTGVGGLGE